MRRGRRTDAGASRRPRTLSAVVALAIVAVVAAGCADTSGRTSGAPSSTNAPSTGATSAGTATAGSSASAEPSEGPAPYSWTSEKLIAHGMGAIGGLGSTNTREAFERNYKRGYRIFEVDLTLTSDDYVVAAHDWSVSRSIKWRQPVRFGRPPTRDTFMRTLVDRRYHPLDAAGIVALMRAHPDAWVMTDIKEESVAGRLTVLEQLLAASGNDPAIARRLIVQIYDETDLAPTRGLGVDNIVYTFYRLHTSVLRAIAFSAKNGIRVVTLPKKQATAEQLDAIRKAGLISATHTINRPGEAELYYKRGVGLIYSDGLKP